MERSRLDTLVAELHKNNQITVGEALALILAVNNYQPTERDKSSVGTAGIEALYKMRKYPSDE